MLWFPDVVSVVVVVVVVVAVSCQYTARGRPPYKNDVGSRRTFLAVKVVDWYRLGCQNIKWPSGRVVAVPLSYRSAK